MIFPVISGDKKSLASRVFFVFFLLCGQPAQASDLADEVKNYLQGKYEPREIPAFAQVPASYALSENVYLQKQTLQAFVRMADAAKKEGIDLYVVSGMRSFADQKRIWEGKFRGHRLVNGKNLAAIGDERQRALEILKLSSMPGTSRHHWGTDLDLVYTRKSTEDLLTNQAFASGQGKKVYDWLQKNAVSFGFCQPYQGNPSVRNPGLVYGYEEEKWHWSYRPQSARLVEIYRYYLEVLPVSGFAGSAAGLEFYRDYILNIHADCKP